MYRSRLHIFDRQIGWSFLLEIELSIKTAEMSRKQWLPVSNFNMGDFETAFQPEV